VNPLDINFDEGETECDDHWTSHYPNESKCLDPSQNSEKEQQRMDLRPCADKDRSKKVVHHANSKYS